MKKKLMKNLLLVLTMVVLCFAVGVMASAEDRAVIASGECGAQGDNVIWTLYDDGELVISGEGAMENYLKVLEHGYMIEGRPWCYYEIHKLTVEEGVTSIGSASFYTNSVSYINLMEEVHLPKTIEEIGAKAFENCKSLKNVTMPDSVTDLGFDAFRDCVNLTSINISKNITLIDDYTFSNCEKLRNVEIPDGVTVINTHAFAFCDSLTSINIPDSVTTIGVCAFYGCQNLTNIYLGSNVSNIDYFAFDNCNKLSSITVDESNKYFSSNEDGVLFNKDKTVLVKYPMGKVEKHYTIPETVTTIDDYAFLFNFKIENVTIPDSVTQIGNYSFYGCFSLIDIIIPASIESIGEYAFGECIGVTNIIINDGVKNIGEGVFAYMPFMDKVVVRSKDVVVGLGAFCANAFSVADISREEFIDLYAKWFYGFEDYEAAQEKLDKHMIYADGTIFIGTIYCHPDSTVEAYAKEYTEMFGEVKYELTHFYKDEWTYDYDNMIRYRKCIHCDELETEPLETTGNGDVEIIEPVDPDTDFVVDVITDYVIIEEALANGIAGDWEIVKAFDITMTGKDGVHVQPDGTVKVKLPLDWSKDGVYKVYRVNEDGTLTDMNAYRQGSHMVFDTDHFSVYVIVDESEKTDAPITPDEPEKATKDNLFTRLLDFIKAFFELIKSFFNR